ncbi:MAG: hypothetical protein SA339_12135 [Methanomassiliicoccus sp.]|nr:hypothetical protein [Methanomassiliicoccus sp.]
MTWYEKKSEPMEKTIKISNEVKEKLEAWMFEEKEYWPGYRRKVHTYDEIIGILIKEHEVYCADHPSILRPRVKSIPAPAGESIPEGSR